MTRNSPQSRKYLELLGVVDGNAPEGACALPESDSHSPIGISSRACRAISNKETDFSTEPVATEGVVTAFSIVSFAAPGVPTPFVAAVIDCDGTQVRGNIINCEPDAETISLGMAVKLATYSLGADSAGTEAIGFGFEPA